jgi:hypothetical protein
VGGVAGFVAPVPEFGLNAAEAARGPLGGDEGIDERELVGVGGLELEEEGGGERFEFGGSSPRMMWDAAWMPDFRALSDEAALPSGEVGPVDFLAFRRLALICACDDMLGTSWGIGGCGNVAAWPCPTSS